MRTIAEPVEGEFVRVEPADEPGIRINGIPADLDHTRKADARVDLVANAGQSGVDGGRAFVVEHVLGPLRLCGVTAAEVYGIDEGWDFSRPEHRFCYSTDLGPAAVVGHEAGLPNPALAAAVLDAGTVRHEPEVRRTVAEPITHGANGGEIVVSPREYGAGVELALELREETFAAEVPAEGADPDVVKTITNSTTPFLAPDGEVAVTHSAADVLSDVIAIGGLDDVRIEANLGRSYHALTVGVARKAHEHGIVVEREGGD